MGENTNERLQMSAVDRRDEERRLQQAAAPLEHRSPSGYLEYCGHNFGYHKWGRPAFCGQEPGMPNNMPDSEEFPHSKSLSDLNSPRLLWQFLASYLWKWVGLDN